MIKFPLSCAFSPFSYLSTPLPVLSALPKSTTCSIHSLLKRKHSWRRVNIWSHSDSLLNFSKGKMKMGLIFVVHTINLTDSLQMRAHTLSPLPLSHWSQITSTCYAGQEEQEHQPRLLWLLLTAGSSINAFRMFSAERQLVLLRIKTIIKPWMDAILKRRLHQPDW